MSTANIIILSVNHSMNNVLAQSGISNRTPYKGLEEQQCDILKVVCESNGIPAQTCYIEPVIARELSVQMLRVVVRDGAEPPRASSTIPKASSEINSTNESGVSAD
jgi:predicted thioredoxin/glutaredoxin